ncbi:hypothetical protein [Burkholderia ubonensis]|uniref:hypothetical protein n=1 Tax=Burkholderia ubonensis TaxID=101571 RepID=UPI00075468A7|nr:hypothetical protein [Burkholderia ubonensis]
MLEMNAWVAPCAPFRRTLAFRSDAIDARGGAIALLPIGEQLMTICGSMQQSAATHWPLCCFEPARHSPELRCRPVMRDRRAMVVSPRLPPMLPAAVNSRTRTSDSRRRYG